MFVIVILSRVNASLQKNGFSRLIVACISALRRRDRIRAGRDSVCVYTTATAHSKAMPTTRQALFQSMGDDVLTQLLATMSFADRSAINSVCKRWRKVVASPGFIQVRRSVGETGLVILGYALDFGPESR